MSFLQTVGIASQASDNFDRQRRGDRMAAMQEESMQRALQADKLDSEIFKLGVQYMMQREQQKAAQKAALLGKATPRAAAVAVPQMPAESAYDRPETSYAQGGEVKATAPKFHGIYDDTLFTGEKVPTIINDMVNDWGAEGYQPYQHVGAAVDDVVRMATGGMVGGDMYNGVQMYADGGKVTPSQRGPTLPSDEPLSAAQQKALGERGLAERLLAEESAKAEARWKQIPNKKVDGGEVEQPQGLWQFVKSRMGMKAGGSVPPKAAVKMKGKGKKPKGGKLKGPGTGTSDSIPASLDGKKGAVALSTGEYVLPKKMVDAIGVENLDRERQKYI